MKRRVILRGIVLATVLLPIVGCGGSDEEAEVETEVAVHVARIARATIRRYVTAYGYVEPAPASVNRPAGGALLTPYIGGVVSGIDCVEGGRVRAEAVCVRLNSRVAEVAAQKARQQLEFAEQVFTRQQTLLRSDGTSQRALLEAQQQRDAARSDLAAAETNLAYHSIAAPIGGTVTRLDVEIGQYVDANTVLGEVVDLDRLIVSAQVPSREAMGLEVGQPVLFASSDSVTGTLSLLARDVDRSTGMYRAHIAIPAGTGLMPGEFTEVRIIAEERANTLVVPDVAVVSSAEDGSWIVVVEGDVATRRPVTIGILDGGLAEITGDGIEEGTLIVTDDAYGLPETTRIRIVDGAPPSGSATGAG